MGLKEDAINLHRMLRGKIEMHNRVSVDSIFEEGKGTLGLIYTPGVAYVSEEIGRNKELAYEYTSKWNNVAIVCDGTRVLGLGNVGPEAAIPVMEGKSVLFKSLADINAIPLCIAAQDKEEIIRIVKAIQPGFGAVNIEDIESPKVLEIVETLKEQLDIPVFHDDQHGTAVITLAALVNALDLVGKKIDGIRAVIAGAGSAGYGIYRILEQAGCRDIIVADSKGAIYKGRTDIVSGNNRYRREIVERTNVGEIRGGIGDIIKGADLFIGVSGRGNVVRPDMIKTMNRDAIVFALSNPDPEILPPDALSAGARIAATGRSDFPNQINNAVVFPSVLRALLDLRARYLDEEMLVAVSFAIAGLVDRKHLTESFIIPKVNDPRILPVVTQTLRDAVMKHLDAKEQVLQQ
ncbi:MAG TPA: NADP-dependent malic enzyme [Nitrososphaera sp.]